jgi:hypothetical protein
MLFCRATITDATKSVGFAKQLKTIIIKLLNKKD